MYFPIEESDWEVTGIVRNQVICLFLKRCTAEVTLASGSTSAAEARDQGCSETAVCVVPEGVALTLDSPLVVGALVVRGTVTWTDATQAAATQWLCAGYATTARRPLQESAR